MKLNDFDSKEWLLVSRKDYQDLIDKAASNGVDTQLLEAVYSWLVDKNVLTGLSKENDDNDNGL